MAKTISELRNQSIQVRDASAAGENTAIRVGTVLNDIVGHIEDYENTQSSNNSSQDAKIEGVKSSLNAEIARAKTEESNLSTQIGTERTERQAAMSREETARIQADNDEKTARQQADNAEQDARIKADNDEKTARENADITLRTMIQTEVSNRQIAVKQEEIRAMAAEKANTQAIEDETSRAMAAEEAETSRAMAAEERLQREIDNTNTNVETLEDKVNSNYNHLTDEVARLDTTDNEIKADLEAETARATAAEQANAQAIAEEKAAIMGTDRIADGAVTLDKIAHESVDDEPTSGSDNLVKSGGVADRISELDSRTNGISIDGIETDEDSIDIEDNVGNTVFHLDENGLDAKNVRSNGNEVLTEHQDISGKQDKIPQISQEETTDNEEEAVFSSDDKNEIYVRVGSYGIKTKAILDLNGNPIQEEKIILPDYFKVEAVKTGNTIKSLATSSATVFNIVTDTHERYWESGDVRAYDMSFENIRNVNKIYKSNALIHLGDILSSNNTNTGKYDSQDVVNAHLKSFFERMRNAHENSVIMLGNHEDIYGAGNGGDAKAIYPNVAIYDYSYNRYKNRPFFYIDNNTGKIRSIFLCCPYQWEGKSSNWTFGQEQIDWLIDTALNVENDWHCIFFSHTPLVSNDMSSSDYKDVIGIINAFNSHTTFTTSYEKIADFSGKTGTKSVAWVCGHEHYDLVVEPKDNTVYPNNNLDCPIIVICCHYRYGASGSVPGASYYDTAYRTQLNANRDLWDTLIYRKDQSKIYMIRFGAGEDRIINV